MKYLFLLIRPFVIWMGKVKMPFTSKQHIFSKFYEIQGMLKDGDIILSTSKGHLSKLFQKFVNKGKYNHTLIYAGEMEGHPSIVEAIGEGVLSKTLPLFLSDKDSICIIRPLQNVATAEQKKKAIEFAKNQIGKSYDFLFEVGGGEGNKAYYCSELIFEAYKSANPNIGFMRRETLGYSSVAPNDFYNAKKFFEVIYEL